MYTFKEHALAEYPKEACGIILNGNYIPLENTHTDPTNFFQLLEKDSLRIWQLLEKGAQIELLHSHTMESFSNDPRTPSYEDMKLKESLNIPCGIIHCDGENCTDILYFGDITDTLFVGRTYVSNVYDCFTLARDYLFNKFQLDVGLHPRPANWEEWNPYYIERTYASLGFTEITKNAQEGDVLLFSIASSKINHIGIYLGEDAFLHHLYNRKSSIDSVSKWKNHLVKILRINNGS